jgi:hypothetical protein
MHSQAFDPFSLHAALVLLAAVAGWLTYKARTRGWRKRRAATGMPSTYEIMHRVGRREKDRRNPIAVARRAGRVAVA